MHTVWTILQVRNEILLASLDSHVFDFIYDF